MWAIVITLRESLIIGSSLLQCYYFYHLLLGIRTLSLPMSVLLSCIWFPLHSLCSIYVYDQIGIFQCLQSKLHIFNPQILIDHSTESNQMCMFSFSELKLYPCYFIFYHIHFWDFLEPQKYALVLHRLEGYTSNLHLLITYSHISSIRYVKLYVTILNYFFFSPSWICIDEDISINSIL